MTEDERQDSITDSMNGPGATGSEGLWAACPDPWICPPGSSEPSCPAWDCRRGQRGGFCAAEGLPGSAEADKVGRRAASLPASSKLHWVGRKREVEGRLILPVREGSAAGSLTLKYRKGIQTGIGPTGLRETGFTP